MVYLHVGTNNLAKMTESEISEKVLAIYNVLHERKIKFIYSNITPRSDEFDAKGQITNIIIAQKLRSCIDAQVCHNENLYNRGTFEKNNYDEDGIHLNAKGTSILALNAKYSICKSLDIRVFRKPRQRPPNRFRQNRYNLNDK